MLVVSIPGLLFADRWGRRTSIITGGLILSGSMLLIGSLYASDSVHSYGSGRWVVVVSIFAFALAYCVTWAITGKLVACEIQPANTRAAANCAAQGLNFFANWLVAIVTPIFLANSSSGAYFTYGALSLATVIVLWISMPETQGRSLESIQESLQRPVLRSWAHQIRRLFSRTTASSSSSISSAEQPLELDIIQAPTPAATSSTANSMHGGILSFESVAA